MKFNKQTIISIVMIFVICYAIMTYWGAGASLLEKIWSASLPFVYGAMVAFIVNIVLKIYEERIFSLIKSKGFEKFKRPLSLILAYATFIVVIVSIFLIVIPDLVSSIKSFTSFDYVSVDRIVKQLGNNSIIAELLTFVQEKIGTDTDFMKTITSYAQQVLGQVLSSLTTVVSSITNIASSIVSMFISLVFSIYILLSKEQLGNQGRLLIDHYFKPIADKIYFVLEIINSNFNNFFVGQTLEALILGSLTFIGMVILGLPYASTIAILVGFTAMIPVAGAYIGTAVGLIMVATQSFSQAIVFLIFLLILQNVEGNLIYPKVVGGSVSLPSMWVLFSITIGGALYGIFGMLVAVPISATIYQLIRYDIYRREEGLDNEESVK